VLLPTVREGAVIPCGPADIAPPAPQTLHIMQMAEREYVNCRVLFGDL
jgi:hypothetical protein